MSPLFEIVIPLRQPGDVFLQSVRSLLAQTDRCFSVLFSDNSPGDPSALTLKALAELEGAGLMARLVRPPEELGRVEHWNWSHLQAAAAWVKPLFVGDWLEPTYAATIRAVLESQPAAEIINCSMRLHHPDGTVADTIFSEGHRSRSEVMAEASRNGNNFGGPVNICFRKLAFETVGGYPPALPVSADFWLILMLALRRGLHTCSEVLVNFNYHPHRFSTNFPYHRISGDRELLITLLAATSQAEFDEVPVPVSLRNRFFARLAKRTGRQWLQRLFYRA